MGSKRSRWRHFCRRPASRCMWRRWRTKRIGQWHPLIASATARGGSHIARDGERRFGALPSGRFAGAAQHRAGVEFFRSLTSFEQAVGAIRLEQVNPLNSRAVLVLGLAADAHVKSGLALFQHAERNLGTALRRSHYRFAVVDFLRHISIIAESLLALG